MSFTICSSEESNTSLTVAWRGGNITDFSSIMQYNLSLTADIAGQETKRCSSVPGTLLQVGALQYPALLLDQCLQSISVLYRPETIFDNTALFAHSCGLLAAVVHM